MKRTIKLVTILISLVCCLSCIHSMKKRKRPTDLRTESKSKRVKKDEPVIIRTNTSSWTIPPESPSYRLIRHLPSPTIIDTRSAMQDESIKDVIRCLSAITRKLKPRSDGAYIPQEVTKIIKKEFAKKEKIIDKNEQIDNIERVLNLAAYLRIDVIAYACAEILLQEKSFEDTKRILNQIKNNDKTYKYFKHQLDLKKYDTQEYSIADLIAIHGQPKTKDGILDLHDKELTSLFGIDQIKNPEKITDITLKNNYIYLDERFFRQDSTPFKRFRNLKYLSLKKNNIEQLPENFFSGLSLLETLKLNNNKLKNLPEHLFSDLKNLDYITLKENQLSGLSPEIFLQNKKITIINIDSNLLKDLPNNIFKNNTELKTLLISHNAISNIDTVIFNTTPNIEALDLSYNTLTSIPKDLLSKLKKLFDLWLDNNKIEDVSQEFITQINDHDYLVTLDLEDNDLSSQKKEQIKENITDEVDLKI